MIGRKLLNSIAGQGGGNDPYFSNVSFLAHFNGADGSKSLVDDSSYANSITATASGVLDTSELKYGSASLEMPTVGGGFQVLNPADNLIKWADADYTLEYWIYPTAFFTGNPGPGSGIGHFDASRIFMYWAFGPINTGQLRLYYYTGAARTEMTTVDTVPSLQWSHLAMTQKDGVVRLFINGVKKHESSYIATPLYSSSQAGFSGGYYYNKIINRGWIDDVRVTYGVARYVTDFTPPTSEFPNQ